MPFRLKRETEDVVPALPTVIKAFVGIAPTAAGRNSPCDVCNVEKTLFVLKWIAVPGSSRLTPFPGRLMRL